MIRILIIDDSDTIAGILQNIFERESDMEVVGRASNGKEGVELAYKLKPDIITMDVQMPGMDGFQATRMIMSTQPIPIVIISSSIEKGEIPTTFRAIEEGAVAVLEKPIVADSRLYEKSRNEICNTVRAMVEVKVIRRKRQRPDKLTDQIFDEAITQRKTGFEIIALGTSTGGPQTLQFILTTLPAGFPLPILVVQHISPGFIDGMINWLRGSTMLDVRLAVDNEVPQAGVVYFSPDNFHLKIARNRSSELVIHLDNNEAPLQGFRPSATPLFSSMANVCAARSIGGLLTGMGSDGAAGLLELRRAGGHTFVQDKASCVIYGMPGSAVAMDAAQHIIELENISSHLINVVRKG